MDTVIEVLRGQCQVPVDAQAQIVIHGEFVVSTVAQYHAVESQGHSARLATGPNDLSDFATHSMGDDKRFHVTWLQRADVGTALPSSYLDPAGGQVHVYPPSQASNTSNTSTAIDYKQSSPERNVEVRFHSAVDRNATLKLYFEGDEWITDVTDVIRSQWGLAPEDEVWLCFYDGKVYGNRDDYVRAKSEYDVLKKMWESNHALPLPGTPQHARNANCLKSLNSRGSALSVHVAPFSSDAHSASRMSFEDTQRPVNQGPRKLKFIDGFGQKLALPFSGDLSLDQVIKDVQSGLDLHQSTEIKLSVGGRRIISDRNQYLELEGKNEPVVWAPTINALMEAGNGSFKEMRLEVSYRRYLPLHFTDNSPMARFPYTGKEKLSTLIDAARQTKNVPAHTKVFLLVKGRPIHWERDAYDMALQELRSHGSDYTPYYVETMHELQSLCTMLHGERAVVHFKPAPGMYDDMPRLVGD
ncbi:hypothetical protein [Hydrogenophaga sp.]|uniref:hypothetical protein n=1 Tax=Hydrogenophaga sp. TaxID=1904254 RepID=UPI00271A4C28|nr:hypothetical protein [Hydrogenophaga sp.]MDO9434986.1 hypothetical protein [Hydrogenophaga sp.]